MTDEPLRRNFPVAIRAVAGRAGTVRSQLKAAFARTEGPVQAFGALLTAQHWRAVLALMVVAVLAFAPGFMSLPPLDRDESRFAQATKQMLQSGDYVDIRFQDEARHKKPIGIYWLQAAAVKATGYTPETAPIWVYRLPSLLGAIVAVLLTYWVGLAFLPAPAAFVGALLMATAIVVGVEARLAKTDSVLLATVLLAQGVVARAYFAAREGRETIGDGLALAFWFAIGAGVLIKGPMILMVVGLTLATLVYLDRDARWLKAFRPTLGIPIALLMVLPWLAAITIATNGGFFAESVGKDLLGKVAGEQIQHGAPPLTYLAVVWATFWPGAAFLAVGAAGLYAARRDPIIRFCLAWALPNWIVFELIPTKLPHYVMPLYPALAFAVVAIMLKSPMLLETRLRRALFALVALLGLLPPAAAFAGQISLGEMPSPLAMIALVLAAVAVVGAYLAARNAAPAASVLWLAGAALFSYAAFYPTAATVRPLWPSPQLATLLKSVPECPKPTVFAAGFQEPSLVFLTDRALKTGKGADAATFLLEDSPDQACRIALVDQRQAANFRDNLGAEATRLIAIGQVDGWNIGGGRPMAVQAYRIAPLPRLPYAPPPPQVRPRPGSAGGKPSNQ